MDRLETRLRVLDHIYKVYDTVVRDADVVCKRYCARCCTRNVTLTTLEAYKLARGLSEEGHSALFDRLAAESGKRRFQPKVTTNQLADLCIQGEAVPEEESDPAWGACPFLQNDDCPVYQLRPFGCRCMVSARDCHETGYADMNPFTVTANNVFLQYIEHIDADGYSGNLTDVLLFMSSAESRRKYREGKLTQPPEGLISNRPVRALMVPPEHRERISPVLASLQNIKA